MKVKIAVEMEFNIPNVQVKKFENCIDDFCEDIAKTVTDETTSAMAPVGINVKYVDHCWAGEYDVLFEGSMLLKG